MEPLRFTSLTESDCMGAGSKSLTTRQQADAKQRTHSSGRLQPLDSLPMLLKQRFERQVPTSPQETHFTPGEGICKTLKPHSRPLCLVSFDHHVHTQRLALCHSMTKNSVDGPTEPQLGSNPPARPTM